MNSHLPRYRHGQPVCMPHPKSPGSSVPGVRRRGRRAPDAEALRALRDPHYRRAQAGRRASATTATRPSASSSATAGIPALDARRTAGANGPFGPPIEANSPFAPHERGRGFLGSARPKCVFEAAQPLGLSPQLAPPRVLRRRLARTDPKPDMRKSGIPQSRRHPKFRTAKQDQSGNSTYRRSWASRSPRSARRVAASRMQRCGSDSMSVRA
ncbi:hypothetical protein A8926_0313 [Saccharopolyspora spinosa]|uniref:Uncharacterized protein n=1 Tax=Saccharopolyspora spinosa TaxID=60894 RepID=A0A2N3XQB7_SACSN|nr:hypothetical protein A8926_0313 [Saccharopolyspora spinosa]